MIIILNEKLTENTPMVEILKELGTNEIHDSADFENINRIAQNFIKEFYAYENVYKAAVREGNTRFETLNEEFQTLHERNPIHSIYTRVKSPKSIVEKLNRKGLDITIENAFEKLDDIAGMRVICPYIEDIYTVKNMIKAQDDIQIIRIRDYIREPKPSGYRSLHLILKIPVYFSDHKKMVKTEIQIRTIAMDFWASLEHQLRYKAIDSNRIPASLLKELKDCADTIAETDLKMQDIHNMVIR